MNQILFHVRKSDFETESYLAHEKTKKTKHFFFFRFVFGLSLFFFFMFGFSFLFRTYYTSQGEEMAKQLASRMNLSTLYSNNQNTHLIDSTSFSSSFDTIYQNLPVIGMITIPKINLSYPILSYTTDELLKLAPCKFYGPDPNEIGNLCIAGHNYDNKKFFSRIGELEKGDEIRITSLDNQTLHYLVYDQSEVAENDQTSIHQETNGKREITLITCNNKTKNRILIKARQT